MKSRLEVELDFITDLSPLELASKVAPLVREAVEAVKQSLGAELEFDIFLMLDGQEIRFVMEPVGLTLRTFIKSNQAHSLRLRLLPTPQMRR